jgi:hypothetical protein
LSGPKDSGSTLFREVQENTSLGIDTQLVEYIDIGPKVVASSISMTFTLLNAPKHRKISFISAITED